MLCMFRVVLANIDKERSKCPEPVVGGAQMEGREEGGGGVGKEIS